MLVAKHSHHPEFPARRSPGDLYTLQSWKTRPTTSPLNPATTQA